MTIIRRGSSMQLNRGSVIGRCHATKPSKVPIEVREVGQSNFIRDHTHRRIALDKPHAGPCDPELAQIIAHALAYMPCEKPVKRSRRKTPNRTQIFDPNRLVVSLMQVVQNASQLRRLTLIRTTRMPGADRERTARSVCQLQQ